MAQQTDRTRSTSSERRTRAPGAATTRRTAGRAPSAAPRRPATSTRKAPAGKPSRRRPGPRRPRLTRWLTQVLALTAGGIVAASQLTPVLVDLTATSTNITNGGVTVGGSTGTSVSDGMLSWSTGSVAGDSNGETVTDSNVPSGLVVPQPPRPNGITVQPWARRGQSPTLTPLEPPCGGYTSTTRIVPGVTAGAGSATVSWMSDDRAEIASYQVSAVSQTLVGGTQPDPLTTTVAQPETCQQLTVTLTGLVPGDTYVFWLEEEVTSPSTGVTRLEQVGTSSPVVIG